MKIWEFIKKFLSRLGIGKKRHVAKHNTDLSQYGPTIEPSQEDLDKIIDEATKDIDPGS